MIAKTIPFSILLRCPRYFLHFFINSLIFFFSLTRTASSVDRGSLSTSLTSITAIIVCFLLTDPLLFKHRNMMTTHADKLEYTNLRQTRLAQMFESSGNYTDGVYYDDFIKYVTTEATNTGSNVLHNKECTSCGYVMQKCREHTKCNKWIFAKFIQSKKPPVAGLVDLQYCSLAHDCPNNKAEDITHCELCNNKMTYRNKPIEETTAKSYWTHSRNILYGALSTWNYITVEDLIRKNSKAFIYRMQMLRGTFKNAHDQTSKKKENLIKPSLEKFFLWLRLRAKFKPEEEDTSNEELQFYGTNRCGNPDCHLLGNFGCFEYMKTKDKDGNDEYVKCYKGDYYNFRCKLCEKEFPICQFVRYIKGTMTNLDQIELLRSGLLQENGVCNYCMISNRRGNSKWFSNSRGIAADMNEPKIGADSVGISVPSIDWTGWDGVTDSAKLLMEYSAPIRALKEKNRRESYPSHEPDITMVQRFNKRQKTKEFEKKQLIENNIDKMDWSGVLPFTTNKDALDDNIDKSIANLEKMLEKVQKCSEAKCIAGVKNLIDKVCLKRSELSEEEKRSAIDLTKLCVKDILYLTPHKVKDLDRIKINLNCSSENNFAQIVKGGCNTIEFRP